MPLIKTLPSMAGTETRSRSSSILHLAPLLWLLLQGCMRPAAAPSAPVDEAVPGATPREDASTVCGDVVGAWSMVVGGLRGRLVTSGSKPDGSALDITLEIENVSGQGPLELHWEGNMTEGFASFRLDDEAGHEQQEMGVGGSLITGSCRATLQPTKIARFPLHRGAFEGVAGRRTLRLRVFWMRELPSDRSRRFLRGQVTGGPAIRRARDCDGGGQAPKGRRGRVWIGSLELPAVCIQ